GRPTTPPPRGNRNTGPATASSVLLRRHPQPAQEGIETLSLRLVADALMSPSTARPRGHRNGLVNSSSRISGSRRHPQPAPEGIETAKMADASAKPSVAIHSPPQRA